MENKEYVTLEELEDKYIGKLGTPEREEYEFALRMDILGEKIKQIRKEHHMTQEELGKLIGVQKAQISKLENGMSSASISTITKVFRAFKANVKLHIVFRVSLDLNIRPAQNSTYPQAGALCSNEIK
jgi:HTH-type transcriptional regulator/antitoxin HipB